MWDLQIDVLGPLDVRQNNGVLLAFESLKARALLVYLAVESDRVHSRETLAGMLWPDRTDSASLSNLRHTLASLRTTLGERLQDPCGKKTPCFNISSNSIQFNIGSNTCVDLIEFEKQLAVANCERDGNWQECIAHLNAAVQLYRGPFLDGFSLRGCPEFEDWVLLRREAISLKLQRALYHLADARVSAGEWENALTTLRQLLQLDPWNEAVHRKVMSLLAALNQRNAALSQYERCRKLLLDELGVTPEEETVRLYEQIRAGVFTGQTILETSSSYIKNLDVGNRSEKLFINHFAGRTVELEKLRRSLNLALAGQGQIVFITGEAGSGKTSLAWEFVHQAMAQQSDLLVAAGRCNGITGFEDPFLPFREAMHMLVCADQLLSGRLLTAEHRRRLNEFFPEIIKSLLVAGPDLIDSFIPRETLTQRIEAFGPGGQTWQKKLKQILPSIMTRTVLASANTYKPQEAFFRLLTELARNRPLILFIDDLQWADVGSVSLFHYLSKRLMGSRIVMVGAYRPEDIVNGWGEAGTLRLRHPLERVRLELQREFGDIDVNLDHSEGIGFIDALIDQAPNNLDKTFRQMLYSHTRGNPLFIVELMRSMQDRGQLMRNEAGFWVQGKPLDWEMLPARVEAVIAERIGRLPPTCLKLLQVASVEGETFTAEALAHVLNLDESQAVGCLSGPLSQEQHLVSALNTTRFEPVVGQAARQSRYRFSHFLFQKYIYSHIDPVERSELHEAVGTTLEGMPGQDSVDRSLQLAWHFQQANLPFKAAEHLLLAGKQAVNLSAFADAKVIYNRCLVLLQQLPESLERSRFEMQVHLAREVPLLATNGWGSSDEVQAANRAIELFDQYHQKFSESSVLLAIYFQADYFSARNNAPEAVARVNLLLDMVNAGSERIDRVLAYSMAGQVYFLVGKLVAAYEYLEKVIENYRQEDQALFVELIGVDPLNTGLVWMTLIQWFRGYPERSRAFVRQAIDWGRQQSNLYYHSLIVAVTGVFLSALRNEPELVIDYARECLDLPVPNNDQLDRIMVETCLGWANVKLGEVESGLDMLNKAISRWKTTDKLIFQPMCMILQADALSLAGQAAEGLKSILSAEALIERTGRRLLEAQAYWVHGEILLRGQRGMDPPWQPDPSAVNYFERAIQVAHQQQSRSLELRATLSLAQLIHQDGRKGEAESRLEAILQQFDEGFETSELRTATQLLAEFRSR